MRESIPGYNGVLGQTMFHSGNAGHGGRPLNDGGVNLRVAPLALLRFTAL